MLKLGTVLTFTVLWAGGAMAGVFSDCRTAVDGNDRTLASEAAEIILFGQGVYVPPEHADLIDSCLKLGADEPFAYSRKEKRFVDPKTAERHNIAYATEQERAKEREEMKVLLEQAAEERERSRQEVHMRLVEGCRAMYRKAPDETITNSLCFDVFLQIGLPK